MSVGRGEVYGFLGAGKTTTLHMLVGLIRPTAGTATVAGHGPGDKAGLAKIGSLIENPGFYPYLSGRENLKVVGIASPFRSRAPLPAASRLRHQSVSSPYTSGMTKPL
jgi:ABC-type multidrug transport system ATPase subunit